MKVNEFDFHLPPELIAQEPLTKRSASRLMVLHPKQQYIEDRHFNDITEYLKPGDVLVRNNTKVIPARLIGTKLQTNARVELLLLRQENDLWECLVGNAKVVKVGTEISFGDSLLVARCEQVMDEGIRWFSMQYQGVFLEVLDQLGQVPLPPYIHQKLEDSSRYQTVYACMPGSAASPTAGLHFTDELLAVIQAKGIEVVDITLHIGLGTFRPVKVDEVLDHKMHHEFYEISDEVATRLNLAKQEQRRIIGVGTTSCRTLEANFKVHGKFVGESAHTDIFIYPPYEFKAIDCLITNFHLPKSTLVMLVSALAGREFLLSAYQHAVEQEYRFFSFGDGMMICDD